MTKREMLSLLIKIAGIYILVQFAPSVAQTLVMLAHQTFQLQGQTWFMMFVAFLAGVVSPAIWIALCLTVIFKSNWLAARLYRDDAPASQLTTLGFREVQLLGYHIIGLLLITGALPQFINVLTRHLIFLRQLGGYFALPADYIPQTTMIATQFVIGLFLFLYPRGLANLWAKIQGKPLTKNDDYDI